MESISPMTMKQKILSFIEKLPDDASIEQIIGRLNDFRIKEAVNKITGTSQPDRYRLRGTVLRYEHPYEPAVPPEDWEVVR